MKTRQANGNKTSDYQAYLAIRSMTGEIVAEKIALLEREYHAWLGVSFSDDGLLNREPTRWSRWKWNVLFFLWPSTIFRQQIEAMAIALNQAWLSNNAGRQQQAEAQNYIRLAAEVRELHKFLTAHFPEEMIVAESAQTSNFQVAKDIMLRARRPKSNIAEVPDPFSGFQRVSTSMKVPNGYELWVDPSGREGDGFWVAVADSFRAASLGLHRQGPPGASEN